VPGTGVLVVETADTSKQPAIREKLLLDFGSFDWDASSSTTPAAVTFTIKGSSADRIRKEATEQAKSTIETRIDQFGVAEPTVQLHGREEDHQILVQMPGVDNPDRVKELIKGQAVLELKAVVTPGTLYKTEEEAKASLGGTVPSDRQILRINEMRTGGNSIDGWYIVERTPIVTGNDLRDARGVPSQQGFGWRIAFNLKPSGAERFGAWTEKNIGNLLAIVLSRKQKTLVLYSVQAHCRQRSSIWKSGLLDRRSAQIQFGRVLPRRSLVWCSLSHSCFSITVSRG
jgi:preprotein translocase subunit SecD